MVIKYRNVWNGNDVDTNKKEWNISVPDLSLKSSPPARTLILNNTLPGVNNNPATNPYYPGVHASRARSPAPNPDRSYHRVPCPGAGAGPCGAPPECPAYPSPRPLSGVTHASPSRPPWRTENQRRTRETNTKNRRDWVGGWATVAACRTDTQMHNRTKTGRCVRSTGGGRWVLAVLAGRRRMFAERRSTY